MNCPKCNNDMERGWLDSFVWSKGDAGMRKKVRSVSISGAVIPVTAFACRKCGKVEVILDKKGE